MRPPDAPGLEAIEDTSVVVVGDELTVSLKAEVDELKVEVNQLKAEVDELKAEVNQLKAEVDQVENLKAQVEQLKVQVAQIPPGPAAVRTHIVGIAHHDVEEC